VTAIVVAGGTLAYARVNFEWQATLIKRMIEDNEVEVGDTLGKLPEDMQDWPQGAELARAIGLQAIVVAAVGLLGSMWATV
jgi:hypothetical protein